MCVVEVLEEDAGVGHGAAAGSVGGESADLSESFVGGEARGIFDEQEDAPDFVARGDGAAGDDGELWRESGDRDQAEVGGAGVELGCADGGQGVMHIVVLAQARGRGFMFEVVEQWGGVQKRDSGDA